MKVLTKPTDFGEKYLTWGASDLVEALNETTWSNENPGCLGNLWMKSQLCGDYFINDYKEWKVGVQVHLGNGESSKFVDRRLSPQKKS